MNSGNTATRDRFIPNPKARLRQQVAEVMRFHHYSLRTEEAYWQWIRRYIFFHGKQHPKDLGAGGERFFEPSGDHQKRSQGHTTAGVERAGISVSGCLAQTVGPIAGNEMEPPTGALAGGSDQKRGAPRAGPG